MKSIKRLKNEANRLIKGAWATLGVPFDFPMVEERTNGLIDVEALIIITLLVIGEDRLITDLPAWLNRFEHLINFQKLKTIFRGLSKEHSDLIIANLNNAPFYSTPRPFMNIFELRAQEARPADKSIEWRIEKINTIENVAEKSLFIKNRLLYGTSFRADLITITHIENIGMKGTDLATLLCANNSTISRIVNDLKACGFLDKDKERVKPFETYPGLFISNQSVWNLCELMNAIQFLFKELKNGVLENINFKNDSFGKMISSTVH
ncbi:MAG: hypothetical protein JW882_04675 [Deltaproteobacteria bacterium]|nr:hypothetical protein [Deltaproteobacteria bacterium]